MIREHWFPNDTAAGRLPSNFYTDLKWVNRFRYKGIRFDLCKLQCQRPTRYLVSVFDEIRQGTGFTRAQYFYDFPVAFYGWNREGKKVQEGIKHNWWRQGMMGSVLAHYEGIKAFSESDFTEDLKSVEIPVLVLHGEDDQIVPYGQAPRAADLLSNGKLISYPGFPHGMPTTEADTINKDILEFIKS